MTGQIKLIDLFAGPGGLGEGFSAFTAKNGEKPFKISLSIEKEASAHRTLELRSFYRQFPSGGAPKEYYEYMTGRLGQYPEHELFRLQQFHKQTAAARQEARQLELGKDNRAINNAIEQALGRHPGNWVLIGGPPCQAYSLVGRSRNRGKKDYVPEEDHRNYLYKEYLKVIARFRPAVFVMENVKGLLSANVDGENIFHRILDDLRCPARAIRGTDKRMEYRIVPLTADAGSPDHSGNLYAPSDYILRAENYGIPQTRHRVILVGIREDLAGTSANITLQPAKGPILSEVIGDLPPLRSGLSKEDDSPVAWAHAIRTGVDRIISEMKRHDMVAVAELMSKSLTKIDRSKLDRGSNWTSETPPISTGLPLPLRKWYRDESGWRGVCNHETRGHIAEDLHRYLFCACFGAVSKGGIHSSPSSSEFPKRLAPNHSNWGTGHFADRYRVQLANRPATTITSHISKDGHYFIHYDPIQCRSLTVREAARIQTFPDNYFFVGNRTQQYVQVGNAVPPYLSIALATCIFQILSNPR